MELKNEFRVGIPVDQAWSTLTDIEFIAPCMPGAQLTEVHGDEFTGGVKVKVGPITAQYKGTARFVELDEANRRIVLEATGRDSRGAGNASAEITAEMTPDGDGTIVQFTTDLKVTGKVAQFGRGVMADVTEKLVGQFVTSLSQKLAEAGRSAAAADADSDSDAGSGADADSGAAAVGPEGSDADSDDQSPGTRADADHAESHSDASPGASHAPSADEAAAETRTDGPRKIDMAEPDAVDLLETAGRPMLKRLLAPLAVVAFFLFNRRRRRRKRRQG